MSNKLIAFENADKSKQEKWKPGRDLLDIPASWRGIFCGPPSSGKSTIVKNLLIKAKPMYKKVLIVHYGMSSDTEGGCSTDDYKEFEDEEGFSIVGLEDLPDPRKINEKKEKMMVVLEDIPLSHLNKVQKQMLDRLYGYASSHRHVTVITCAQDAFDVPVGARRCSNVFILWRQPDLLVLSNMASRTGYTASDFRQLFKLCKNKHDSIWIDLTDGSLAPLRLNGYTRVELNNNEE